MNPKKIVVIGSGNVAHHIIKSITSAGHKLMQIYNRTLSNIDSNLPDNTSNIGMLFPDADIYIVCVKDDAISSLAKQIRVKDKLIIHTSGNKSMDLLKQCSENYGIFYPIQTFSKDIPLNFQLVPIIIEANNGFAAKELKQFAQSISKTVVEMDEEKRQKLNIAGVFVNNFTNLIFSEIYDYLSKNDIPFSTLLPLIQNTIDKLRINSSISPFELQTGPAVRGDLDTIRSQKEILANEDFLQTVYELFTQKIISKTL